MAISASGFDYFRKGEPIPIEGGISTSSLDYFRKGEPYPGLIMVPSASAPPAASGVSGAYLTAMSRILS